MSNFFPTVLCPECCGTLKLQGPPDTAVLWRCDRCAYSAPGNASYVDLIKDLSDDTSDHYSIQWGDKLGFLDFIQRQPTAKSIMPAARLGWDQLFAEIQQATSTKLVYAYDAACGFGGLANELITEHTFRNLRYVGADIHGSLCQIQKKISYFDRCGLLMRWDISERLPIREKFDYVLCRASLHHTSNPDKAFSALCAALKPGGKIAISVYNKKGICREASDTALREVISRMPNDRAFQVCRQFTVLGKALQQIQGRVTLDEDLPLLGIRKGEYSVQELVYYHLLKCFNNDEYGEKYSTLVNFDWYHPPYAYRYQVEEVKAWFEANEIDLTEITSIDVQHYLVGIKPCKE